MRICICDYSGHPFQVQLSRELARRSHRLLHLHFAEFQTPKGKLTRIGGDPATFEVEGILLGRPFAKYELVKRRSQEIEVGRLFADRIASFSPDVVMACNMPLDALRVVMRACKRAKRPFVFWQQDIYSKAITNILAEKYGGLGRLIGRHYRRLERRAVADSDAVVVIAEHFRHVLEREFGVPTGKARVIENWAPLDDIAPRPKDNPWALAHGLARMDVVLYTGTLGLKHDPARILALAEALQGRPRTRVVVVSEGPAADWLAQQKAARLLASLEVLPFQPFETYPEVLGAADILVAMVETDAAAFSVPSKVLSYLCSGRPTVLSAPPENLCADIVNRSGGGIVVGATDRQGFVAAVLGLLDDAGARSELGRNGRAYAERAFAIQPIADRFEEVIATALARAAPSVGGET